MRAAWKGTLAFGLVSIPVKLYRAAEARPVAFEFLHKPDLSPLRSVRICRREGIPVDAGQLVLGYEYEPERYAAISSEDLRALENLKKKTLDIAAFAEEKEIDSAYFMRPFFLEPDAGADQAYAIFRDALLESGKVGIGTFVYRNREYAAMVKPQGKAIMANQMRFKGELRNTEGLLLTEKDAAYRRETALAVEYIRQASKPFDPDSYKDTYTERLRALIEEKVKEARRKREPLEPPKKDLRSLLRESIERLRGKKN